MGMFRRILILLLPAIPSGIVSYLTQRALKSWGVLDAHADAFGQLLKRNVTPEQAGWTIALAVGLILYTTSLILSRRWARKTGLGSFGQSSMENSSEKRFLISEARSFVANEMKRYGKKEDADLRFCNELQRSSIFIRLRPYLSEKFKREVMSGRVVVVPADGASLPGKVSLFLDEIERLENEQRSTNLKR